MNTHADNLKSTIVPKSDQLNSEQLMTGSITITVTSVKRGNAEQPVIIGYDDDPTRPYKPCKTMRKVLIYAWGDNGNDWIGRSMTLYNDPEVKFGGVKVGGIRISHLSHIANDLNLALTTTRGKKSEFVIKRMDTYEQQLKQAKSLDELAAIWQSIPKQQQLALTAVKDERKASLTQPESK